MQDKAQPLHLESDDYRAHRAAAGRSFRARCGGCDRILGEARVLPGGRTALEKTRFRTAANGTITAGVSRPKVRWELINDNTLAVMCPCGKGVIFRLDTLPELLDRAEAEGRRDFVLESSSMPLPRIAGRSSPRRRG